MMVFVEFPAFTRDVQSLLTDDSYARLQGLMVATPAIGDIIPGGGGIRKVRWALPGRGKSGGARVIYYWAVSADRILMLRAYAKSEKVDLTQHEISLLRQVVAKEFP